MSHFETLLPLILGYEGVSQTNPSGLSVIPGDTGNETNWGISQTAWNKIYWKYAGYPQFVRDLTFNQITVIYSKSFYPSICDTLPLAPALVVFDAEVNSGNGIHILQRALKIHDDGIVGPETSNAIRLALRDIPDFTEKLLWARIKFYTDISKPSSVNQSFLAKFWLPRLLTLKDDAAKFGTTT